MTTTAVRPLARPELLALLGRTPLRLYDPAAGVMDSILINTLTAAQLGGAGS